MGKTIVEKILSKNLSKSVNAGDEALFSPDIITAYDYPGYIDKYEDQLRELGINRVSNKEKYIFFIDHFVPASSAKEQELHQGTRRFAKENGIKLVEGRGIGHQVIMEMGYARPYQFVVHFDGHISTVGALGCLGIGIRNSMIEAIATEQVSLVVPGTVRIELEGTLQPGVTARDVFHTIVQRIGPAGARACVIEYGGKGLRSLDMDERMTLCNQAMFLGGISSIMETDERVYNFFRERALPGYEEVVPDDKAHYERVVPINLTEIEPVIVVPPSPANTVPIRDVLGTPIHSGYIGSCASGRVKDFEQAATILKGRKVKDGFRLNAVPTSTEIQAMISKMGITAQLVEAGALVSFPSCDFCVGRLGALADGESSLSTGTLNIPGRMGSTKANIYTASPYTIAASSIFGKITDPREFF
ncbi:homoaconitate hydratase family protein [Neobacillus bataviensis LMG 21833]|uniref:aconitate hydratase n=1 Tax=Neobacillus bataviensis LMG 21833 TaxID=1117379 RepID=K6EDX4_9BACI|nr:aconitase family protein [Neobacillus bataviensis]EKN71681.1 homoaconitate hydratase family protein [Neobacillus bataviensis LMG 21833]